MNVPITDPLQGGVPEVIEEYLEHGVMKCVAFNRWGTLLAAGCSDGSLIIWDFETRGISRKFMDKDCAASVTSVCWSKYGHRILVSAVDNSLTLWDVIKGEKVARSTLQHTPMQAHLYPRSSTPSICLVCPLSSAPLIVDLLTQTTKMLPVSLPDVGNSVAPPSHTEFSDRYAPFTHTAACFNKHGDLVYVGNSRGEILIIDHERVEIRGVISKPGSAVIKNIVFSRNGLYLLTNSNDRTIRIYENLLPLKDALKALDKSIQEFSEQDESEKLKGVGSRCLALVHEFRDLITGHQLKAPCFSGKGEWVAGGSPSRGEHKMYIWDRSGRLVKILDGPKEAVVDIAWHPVKSILVSASLTGLVYIWAKDYVEPWSAFTPGFIDIEDNILYAEREDEFDLVPDIKVKDSDVDEDEDVDIMTIEKDPAFSDSDMSQGEVRHLPIDLIPDFPEEDVSKFASHFSEEPVENDHLTTNHASSTPEEDPSQARGKRERMPSQKLVDYVVENVKKRPSD